MKSILALAGGTARLEATLDTALLAARRLDARLCVLHVRAEPEQLAYYAGDMVVPVPMAGQSVEDAEEIIAGSFRNIAATVVSVDAAGSSITVNDLATKKPVVIHINADSQLHKLPAEIAQRLAARFKRANGGNGNGNEGAGQQAADSGNGQTRSGDSSQLLQRTPTVQIADLHKGDAVMIVATQGTPDAATAVTLLAGVEPLLEAPAASQNLLSNWSMGSGSAEGAAGNP